MENMVVSARGTEHQISQTPGGVGVVNEKVIFKTQPTSITNVTTRIPGVDKISDSAWGSAINIRGLGRNRVVFLIDGCRVNTATDINAQFGLIDPQEIERIEVLKGPISALYGSGSIGGIVNIITKKEVFRIRHLQFMLQDDPNEPLWFSSKRFTRQGLADNIFAGAHVHAVFAVAGAGRSA